MKTSGHKITIDLKDNPDLAAYFAAKEVGHSCTLEVEFQLNEKSPEQVSGTIEAYRPEGYEAAAPEEDAVDGEIEAKTEEPAMIVMGKDYGKKGKTEAATA